MENCHLLLIDSRARSATGMRIVHKFDETLEGVITAWAVVIQAEAPDDEANDYAFLYQYQRGDNVNEACGVFNDYWSEYGWRLGVYEADWTLPDDCILAK